MTAASQIAAEIASQIAQARFAASNDGPATDPIQRVRYRVERSQVADFDRLSIGLPDYLKRPLRASWHRLRKQKEAGALARANTFVREFMTELPTVAGGLPIGMDDDELGSVAHAAANDCAKIMAQAESGEAVPVVAAGGRCVRRPRFVLEAFAKALDMGVLPSLDGLTPAQFDTLQKRLADEKWWRGRLKRFVTRAVEQLLIRLGCVHRKRSPYLSEGSLTRLLARDARNEKALALAEATNERGQTYTLAELSRRTVANPAIRRTELMVRVRGTEELMNALGYEGYFITITAPSKYHACSDKYGTNGNPRYNPRDTQDYLCANWAQCRAQFNSKHNQIPVIGVRVVEPHHDATPHWHMLVWVPPHQAEKMLAIMRAKALEVDGCEPGAADHRMTVEKIDPRKGSAVGYIAKYLAKNIDGEFVGTDDESGLAADSGARRVAKWATCWRIRQFQMFGQPPVTIWRELRKVRALNPEHGDELILRPLHAAADAGDWARYCNAYRSVQGGLRIGFEQLTEPNKTSGEMLIPLNKYGEPKFVRAAVAVFDGTGEVIERIQTRLHEWDVKWGRDQTVSNLLGRIEAAPLGVDFERSGAAASTWTCVNNCNRSERDDLAQRDLLHRLDQEIASIQTDSAAQIATPDFAAALNQLAARNRTTAQRGRSYSQALADLDATIARVATHSPAGAGHLREQRAVLESIGPAAYDVRP
ncbi:Bacteriophage replication gene A protein (GPA) [Andreprevotia lacus DSM 23236]|jgi:hypothetical protein|uniref:Bacteriophage replication gene A protein (GPA) n=1 Tax=Andreprevotia lacus DSM 23236 TaxID=1121001 RepID=A0A1W1XJX1_9NEIS|nr:replication endonuclease [Andreprevotia lacus]SMC24276.1 Bacteriophage replication gene A protein (GPA) [Andreprevotia lacus DSM 23236]